MFGQILASLIGSGTRKIQIAVDWIVANVFVNWAKKRHFNSGFLFTHFPKLCTRTSQVSELQAIFDVFRVILIKNVMHNSVSIVELAVAVDAWPRFMLIWT
jgi:hypothetical protein